MDHRPSSASGRFLPISFTKVHFDPGFWAQRIKVNREATLDIQYQQCKSTGRIDAFAMTWKEGDPNPPHVFWDSDVAKWIEAVSYSLSTHPDAKLDALLDEVIALIASAQESDGYLNTHFSQVEPDKRWTNLRDNHELYCAGHMIEAAVAHFHATGKQSLLDVMCRYADYIDSVFGIEPGKKRGYCGHEEIELALFKLHRATANPTYFRLAAYFVNERGHQPFYFDLEALARGETKTMYVGAKRHEYTQAHLPVREQTQIVGHAVRAMYLYCAMADLANATDDKELWGACRTIWDDLVGSKMYLTGGIGNSRHNEGFTHGYDLPNDTAYCETCAAIGLVFWAHRLVQADCDSRFSDVMERALYNGVISGVSLDGTKFFYENPLASAGSHHRQAWFGCACCPPNAARLLSSLGQYAYSQNGPEIAVHLYTASQVQTTLPDGTTATLRQETQYPWNGRIGFTLETSKPKTEVTLRLRVPWWCRSATFTLNGKKIEVPVTRGYAVITHEWEVGDALIVDLEMPVEQVEATPHIAEDIGRVALQRGPIVYCLEQVDQTIPIQRIALPAEMKMTVRDEPAMLDGISIIDGHAIQIGLDGWEGQTYRTRQPVETKSTMFRAIPYYAWDNRTAGEMAVWLHRG